MARPAASDPDTLARMKRQEKSVRIGSGDVRSSTVQSDGPLSEEAMSQDYAKPFGTLGTPGYRFLDVYPRKPSFGGPIIALAAAAANLTASAVKAGSTKRAAKAAEAQAAADAQARQIEAYYAAAAAQQDAAAQAAATQQLITAKTQRQKRWALYGLGALAAAGSAYVIYRIV